MDNKKSKGNTTSVKAVDIVKKDLTFLIADCTSQVYGVVGFTTVKTFKNQLVILKRENYFDGIIVERLLNGKYDVEIHLVVAYGIRITEVINEAAKRIEYEVKKRYGAGLLNMVNVYVDDLLDLQ